MTNTALSPQEIAEKLPSTPEWSLVKDGKALERKLRVKGFSKAVYASNLAIFLADQINHHPDIQLGWGYCTVTFTTHDTGGLTALDFEAAQRFDAMYAPTDAHG
jgi:4a-hydroxytetrahydrobiopterin dehydratase